MKEKEKPYRMSINKWLTDKRLRTCSCSAQGLYLLLLLIQHEDGVIRLSRKQDESSFQALLTFLALRLNRDEEGLIKTLDELGHKKMIHMENDTLILYKLRASTPPPNDEDSY